MDEKKAKDPVACLSSESEEEEEEEDYEDDEEMSGQSCSDEESDWNEEEEADLESSEDDDGSDDDDKGGLKSTKVIDSEDSCNRVIFLLKGGSDLQELKLVECKAYLRKHGLRLTGNKAVCIQRIKEHWRSALYDFIHYYHFYIIIAILIACSSCFRMDEGPPFFSLIQPRAFPFCFLFIYCFWEIVKSPKHLFSWVYFLILHVPFGVVHLIPVSVAHV
ncbi:zinc finger CCCH domain-containing protein 62-like [Macadamia integrifolia]|uniref:zinc finger CCCH domain-containing protein 62-like n=1 Tax=Macadamia integrifolia TaxID=60698 RepID=UPI001C4FBBAE|nr:zinc finger CCCH domain-containing protein 62-like [Macadamia integrifolia]